MKKLDSSPQPFLQQRSGISSSITPATATDARATTRQM